MVKKISRQTVMAKSLYTHDVLKKKNVVGVGIGYKTTLGKQTKEEAVVVMVKKKETPAALSETDLIHKHIFISDIATPTDVIEVGHIEALKARTDKWRPAPGGVSIGHYKITAGTLGVVCEHKFSGQKVILSNNHVLANSNDAEIGDSILQPGPIDGGSADDKIATLYKFEPIYFGDDEPDCDFANLYVRFGNWLSSLTSSLHKVSARKINPQAVNRVDAALAMPLSQNEVTENILEIGEVEGVEEGYLGLKVQKSGRTTELTQGEITMVNATIDVSYGNKVARFEDQLLTGYMSQGGDSGSLVTTRTTKPKAVGLLFAGSSRTTVLNPIQHVIAALDIEF
ncbi:MAG: chymotrypsin family serine protease [Planctomycetota bacterium]